MLRPSGSTSPEIPISTDHLGLCYEQRIVRWARNGHWGFRRSVLERWIGGGRYEPRKSAMAPKIRIRFTGAKCNSRNAYRDKAILQLQPFRHSANGMFRSLFGKDYGVAIGLYIPREAKLGPLWHEIISIAPHASMCPPTPTAPK